ncbi:uncharacterized protein LOC108680992 [Hyalella azteca]|uniref:Uncharacterized protein LOC108680992 n=1 Tax=Hyalella azteca TaxID=294128 RepID=A0A8B7PHD9_HYAAZ|nr:uncharacterized protein LOC108680992 [Hyalella azteca]
MIQKWISCPALLLWWCTLMMTTHHSISAVPAYQLTVPQPEFAERPADRNVTAFRGQTSRLPCTVRHLSGKQVSWIRLRDLTVLSSGRITFATDARISVLPGKKRRTRRSLESDNAKTLHPVFDNSKKTNPKKLCRARNSEADKLLNVGRKLRAAVGDYFLTDGRDGKFEFKRDCRSSMKRSKRNHNRASGHTRRRKPQPKYKESQNGSKPNTDKIFHQWGGHRKHYHDAEFLDTREKDLYRYHDIRYPVNSVPKSINNYDYNYQEDDPNVNADSVSVALNPSQKSNNSPNVSILRWNSKPLNAPQRNLTLARLSKVVLRPIEPVPSDASTPHNSDRDRARKPWLSAVSSSSLLPPNYLEGVWEPEDYTLQIKFAEPGDAGTYVCQINTEPKTAQTITLTVVDMVAKILGPNELFVKAGTPVTLVCQVEHSADLPGFIFWYKGTSLVDYEASAGRIAVMTRAEGKSELVFRTADQHDSANYTCRPSGGRGTSVTLNVIVGQYQHDSANYTC